MKSGGLLVLASQKWSRKRTDEKKEENEEENGRVQKKPMFPLRFINLNIYFLVCCSFSCLLLNLRTNFLLSVQCWFFIFFSHCVGVAFFFYCEYFCIETRIVWFHLVVAGSQKNSERERENSSHRQRRLKPFAAAIRDYPKKKTLCTPWFCMCEFTKKLSTFLLASAFYFLYSCFLGEVGLLYVYREAHEIDS